MSRLKEYLEQIGFRTPKEEKELEHILKDKGVWIMNGIQSVNVTGEKEIVFMMMSQSPTTMKESKSEIKDALKNTKFSKYKITLE